MCISMFCNRLRASWRALGMSRNIDVWCRPAQMLGWKLRRCFCITEGDWAKIVLSGYLAGGVIHWRWLHWTFLIACHRGQLPTWLEDGIGREKRLSKFENKHWVPLSFMYTLWVFNEWWEASMLCITIKMCYPSVDQRGMGVGEWGGRRLGQEAPPVVPSEFRSYLASSWSFSPSQLKYQSHMEFSDVLMILNWTPFLLIWCLPSSTRKYLV